jgi:CRISPR/Cas system endoribonuclease Cas6 (RAMP superfamily)
MGALLVFGVVCGVGDEGGFGFGLRVMTAAALTLR